MPQTARRDLEITGSLTIESDGVRARIVGRSDRVTIECQRSRDALMLARTLRNIRARLPAHSQIPLAGLPLIEARIGGIAVAQFADRHPSSMIDRLASRWFGVPTSGVRLLPVLRKW